MAHRILVVDDDEDVREVIADVLREVLGCEVHGASDRLEALALLECYSYSLVITDLSFSRGRKEGLDLVEQLATMPFRPAVIAVSGQSDSQEMALRLGADAFMPKPLEVSQIAAIVRRALEDPRLEQPRFPRAHRSVRLDSVLMQDDFRVHAQPIYRINECPARLHGLEFLTRGPAGSLFERPDVLFAYARAAHAEDLLDRRCIQHALKAAVAIPSPIRFSLNVHASTLCKPPEFARWLAENALRHRVDPERITVEIVEHSPAWNQDAFLRALTRLREIGVKIALDDIGLGHSNYQMMVDARPDYFKLDRYFVNGCGTDPHRRAVVSSVARLADEFGATVVAEGVETTEDVMELQRQGIHLVQSFMYCRPKPVPEALAHVFPEQLRPCSCSGEIRMGAQDCAMRGVGLCSIR